MTTRTSGGQDLHEHADRRDLVRQADRVASLAVLRCGLAFLMLNFRSFIEVGLSRSLVGRDAASMQPYSPSLVRYISHLQVNLAAVVVGLGGYVGRE